MPQSLLAFLGMMILVFFSLQQQRDAVQAQREIVSTELEIMASSVAAEKARRLLGRRFDRNVSGNLEAYSNPSALTPESDFGQPGNCWNPGANCQYVDDFDDDTHTAAFEVYSYIRKEVISFDFEVDTEVSYVNEDGSPSSSQTWHKQVKLTLRNERYMPRPVTITRRYSPLEN